MNIKLNPMRLMAAALALAAIVPAEARRLDPQEALSRAGSIMPGSSSTGAKPTAAGAAERPRLMATGPAVASDGTPAYYIFTDGSTGMVTTADDRLRPVLGYFDAPSDGAGMPPALSAWLEDLAREQQAFLASPEAASADPLSRAPGSDLSALYSTLTPIAPLVKTHWGQNAPYNNDCPVAGGKRCVTGCVATAMAQVLYYHQWTDCKDATARNTTTGMTYKFTKGKTFDWDLMVDNYNKTAASDASKAAVADLMYACGMSVNMQYSPSGSGAVTSVPGFVNYFGYDPATTEIYRSDYQAVQWESMIWNYLSNFGPIIYSGRGDGGHTFVMDGYDTDGLFHINWGWDGYYEGYFSLTALNPYGPTNYTSGYTGSQSMALVYKPTDKDKPAASTLHPTLAESLIYEGNLIFTFYLSSYDPTTAVNVGLMFYPDATLTGGQYVNWRGSSVELSAGRGFSNLSAGYDFDLSKAKLSTGSYYVVPVLKVASTGETIPMSGGRPVIATVASNGKVTFAFESPVVPLTVTSSLPTGATIYKGDTNRPTFTFTNSGSDTHNDTYQVALIRQVANPDQKDDEDPFMDEIFVVSTIAALVEPGDQAVIPAQLSFSSVLYSGPKWTGTVPAGAYSLVLLGSYNERVFTMPVTLAEGTGPASETTTPVVKEIACGNATLLISYDSDNNAILSGVKEPVESLNLMAAPVAITKIADRAFERDMTLRSITIPAGVKEIGSNAFRLCGNLSKVTFKNQEPPFAAPEGLFYGISADCVFTVPAAALEAYEALLEGWGTVVAASTEVLIGDVNGSGDVNIDDIVATVNHILGNTPANFNAEAADANLNGEVEVGDVVAIVNIILGLTPDSKATALAAAPSEAPAATYEVDAAGTLWIDTPMAIGGVQFIAEGNVTACDAAGALSCSQKAVGEAVRFVAYGNASSYLPAGRHAIATVSGAVTSLLVCDPYGTPVAATDATLTGLTLPEADGAEAPVEVYSLSGVKAARSLDGLAPGLYIVRRGSSVEKILVK